jgi:phosphopantothenoylcysteine decarboxylase/phosphopantothenate--cysteine ligase
VLASNKEIYLAPAMNVRMWEHQSTKQNLKKLINYGYKLIGPEIGEMACGEYGEGKMSEPDKISNEINNYFINLKKNKKLKALVTAGPTNEYIDPVRFITNKSSGKQGYEIAKSLSKKGFNTTLISGPTNLKIDNDIKLIEVETADEMLLETQKNLPADVAVFSAAVADFKINKKYENKIKKQDTLNINLEKNVDILSYVSNHNSMRPDLVIGFAAETDNVENNAETKLNSKNCDWIIANDVSNKKIGFNSDFNEVTIHYSDKNKEKLSYKKKSEISDEIVDRIINQLN